MPITIDYDVASAKKASADFIAAIRAQINTLSDFKVKMLEFDKVNNLAKTTIQSLDAEGRKVTRTFEGSAAAFTLVKSRVTETTKTMEEFGNKSKGAADKLLLTYKDVARLVERQLVRRAILALSDAFIQGIKSAAEYEIKLQQVANIGGITGQGIQTLAGDLRRLSESYGVDNTKLLINAQTALSSQFGDTSRGLQVLDQATKLSLVSGTDLTASTKLITSALDAFRLNGDSAAKVTDTLYAASKRTRIPLDELQNALGRVGPVAQKLGVSFEQTIAAFLSIAQQGGRPVEALSLASQVMGKLLEPSKELQKVLASWGTPTGEAAVSTFGFAGVLQKLDEEADKSPGRLEEIAGSLKNLRGLLGLTGDQTIRFGTNLQALGLATGQVSKDLEKLKLLPAQKLQEEVQKIKNYFTQDLGKSALTTLAKLSEGFGGVEGAATSLGNAIKITVTTLVFYKASTLLATAATLGFKGSLTAVGAALSVNPYVALTTALVALVTTYRAVIDEIEKNRIQKIEEQIIRIKNVADKAKEQAAQTYTEETTKFKEQLDERFRASQKFLADNVRLALENKEKVLEAHKGITDSFKVVIGGFTDSLRTNISEVKRSISDAETAIKDSLKSQALFKDSAQKGLTSAALASESDPIRAKILLQKEYNRLVAEGLSEIETGDKAQVASGREKLKEAERVRIEIFNKDKELRKQQVGNNQPQLGSTGTSRLNVAVEYNALQRDTTRLVQLEAQAEERSREALQQKIKDQTEIETKQKAQLRSVELAIAALEKFRVFTPTGKPVFQDAGQLDTKAALTELNRLEGEVRKRAEAAGATQGTPERRAIEKELYDLKISFEREIRAQQNVTETERHQQALSNIKKEFTERQNVIQAGIKANQDELIARKAITEERLLALKKLASFEAIGTILPGRDPNRTDLPTEAETERIAKIRKLIDEAKEANRRFSEEGSGENKAKFIAAIDAIKAKFEELNRTRGFSFGTPQDVTKTKVPGLSGETIQSVLDKITQSLSVQAAAQNHIKTLTEDQKNLNIELNKTAARTTADIPSGFKNIGEEGSAAGKKVSAGFEDANKILSDTILKVDALNKALQNIPKIGFGAVPPIIPEAHAAGGIIDWSPRGTDTIPAMLSPGEYIMDSHNTRKFYSQLVSMSHGIQPRYYSSGGSVNIGDIHVNVQGGETSEKTVREIGRQLQREIKRGTIRLY